MSCRPSRRLNHHRENEEDNNEHKRARTMTGGSAPGTPGPGGFGQCKECVRKLQADEESFHHQLPHDSCRCSRVLAGLRQERAGKEAKDSALVLTSGMSGRAKIRLSSRMPSRLQGSIFKKRNLTFLRHSPAPQTRMVLQELTTSGAPHT